MPEHIKRVVLFTGLVGLRLNEVLTLTADRVDLVAAQLFVPGRLSENRRPKAIDLAACEVQLLREQLLARPRGAEHVFATSRGKGYAQSAFREHVWWPAVEKGHTDGGALIRRRYRHLYPGEAASQLGRLDAFVREPTTELDARGTAPC
jgi:integrase